MEETLLPRRWGVLAALFIALLGLQTVLIMPGGAALAIMQRYACDPTMFSMVMSVSYFTGVLFGLFSGTLSDRIGVKKVFLVGFILALLGSIWRALSGDSYVMLFLSSFVIGFATAVLNANSAKVIRAWFPGKFASTAFGIYVCGASAGAAVGLQVGARIGIDPAGVGTCWWISVVVLAVVLVCWVILYRDHPNGVEVEEPLSKHLGAIVKSKSVWGISLFAFFFLGCTPLATTYMIPGLQIVNGATPDVAANLSTVNTVTVCVSCLVLPGIIAKFKRLRPVMWVLLICTGFFYAAAFVVGSQVGIIGTTIIIGIGGVWVGGIMASAKSMPALLPDLDPKYLGAAGGFHSMWQNLGMWLVPAYIVPPICQAVSGSVDGPPFYMAVFSGLFACCIIAGIIQYIYPNLGTNGADMLADRAAAEGGEQ